MKAKQRIEHFAQLSELANSPIRIVVSESRPTVTIEAKALFTATPIERLKYNIRVPSVMQDRVSLDASTGVIMIRAMRTLPTAAILPFTQIREGRLVIEFNVGVYATNQFNKSSPDAVISIQEHFVSPPEQTTALPSILHINESSTSQTVDLNRFFRDPQNRPLTFAISGAPSSNAASVGSNGVITVRHSGTTQEFSLTVTVNNGAKSITASSPIRVRDEFILPPVAKSTLPSITFMRGGMTSTTINLNDYFQDASQNASLLSTAGRSSALTYTVSMNPATAQSAMTFSGSSISLRSLVQNLSYTITVVATNSSNKTISQSFSVRDTQPVNCQVSGWSDWSACTASCGGGTQSRSRTVQVSPQNGGDVCPSLTESQSCNTQSCSRDCQFNGWERVPGTTCNGWCGNGTEQMRRLVIAPAIGNGMQCPVQVGQYQFASQDCWTGRPCPPPPPPTHVTLYEDWHANWNGGVSKAFGVGRHNCSDLGPLCGKMSSFKLEPNSAVWLYKGNNFDGEKHAFWTGPGGLYNMENSYYHLNDRVGSIEVFNYQRGPH